jgi:hypothetical protein
MFLALTGLAVLHLLRGNDTAAAASAAEALELYRGGDPRRFKNRIDTESELRAAAAASSIVLAALAANRDEPDQAAVLLEQAERLHVEAGAEIPPFLQDDVDNARKAVAAALAT